MLAEKIRLNADARFFSVVSRASAGKKHTPHRHNANPARNARPICAISHIATARKALNSGSATKHPISSGRSPIFRASWPAGNVPTTVPSVSGAAYQSYRPVIKVKIQQVQIE